MGWIPVEHYPALRRVLTEQMLASPYMEKYVLEALCLMGYHEDAAARMKLRYREMLESGAPTLWELFPTGGSANHAWSGGPLVIMSRYLAGVRPLKPGFEKFLVKPVLLKNMKKLEAAVPTGKGTIEVSVCSEHGWSMTVTVPEGTEALVAVKKDEGHCPQCSTMAGAPSLAGEDEEYRYYNTLPGTWKFEE